MRIVDLPLIIVALAIGVWHVEKVANKPPQVQELFKLAQDMRDERGGLQCQTLDPVLCKKAQKWAEHMAATGSMTHGGGEQIIARGFKTPVTVLNSWCNSPGHARWIFSNNSRVGFGFAISKSGHPYWAGCYRK
jgi:uncharacterized protein YkwD